jgi:8-amino-7-oxononanoate synthase
MTPNPLEYLADELAELAKHNLLRERLSRFGEQAIDVCSNDYLGYRASGRLVAYALRAAAEDPAGAGASRLVTGDHPAHTRLETALTSWLGTEESLVFTSGYAANVGAIAALAGEGDLVVSDVLNHASIIDGCRLSRARVIVVPHLGLEEIRRALREHRARRRWVVTESCFSMDGDGPDLRALRDVCDEAGAALILDEAHALGVEGPQGRGRAAEAGIRPDVFIGTLGKALATQGAFVSGSRDLCRWLWNRARSLVFSTGLSPLVASIATAAVSEASADDGGRARIRSVASQLRERLTVLGVSVASRTGPILPIVLGSEARALTWKQALAEHGVRVQAIRPPTVPSGTSRLRVTARASLTDADLERVVEAFGALAARECR